MGQRNCVVSVIGRPLASSGPNIVDTLYASLGRVSPNIVAYLCDRAEYVHEPGIIKDVFDSSHYQSLLNTIVPADMDHPFFHFSDERDKIGRASCRERV